jgi:hypothetical protein
MIREPPDENKSGYADENRSVTIGLVEIAEQMAQIGYQTTTTNISPTIRAIMSLASFSMEPVENG